MFSNFDPTTILWFLVSLTILVAIHEFGHFYVARRSGVKVLRFSIGFGPRLFGWRDKQGTEYAFSAIPLGGYVKMLGERDEDFDPADSHMAHDKKSVPARIAIAAAGPLANFILAILLYWVFFINGTFALSPVIGEVESDSIASQAGLEAGQQIVAIDGASTATQRDVLIALLGRLGETGDIEFSLKYPNSDYIYESKAKLEKWLQGAESPDPIAGIGIAFYRPPVSREIHQVVGGSAAEAAGMRAGDIVVGADGRSFQSWQEWTEYVKARPEQGIQLEVEREGERLTLALTPAKHTLPSGEVIGRAGVAGQLEPWPDGMLTKQRFGVIEAFVESVGKTWETAGIALMSTKKVIFGEISVKNLSGPIGIAKVAGDSGRAGALSFLQFLAYMSVLLGVLNLLPIPMLDGGHILFYTVEWIKGSPLPEKVQFIGYQAGLVMILAVTVIAFYNDILRL
ncbi:MAG: RIP metalloprotease RseP [Cellvibrionaceae bacterium]|nr:RIP metalloprotease RseP [Cellvibrionaceae bacterium]